MQKRLPSSEEEEDESSFSGERLELDHLKSWRFLFTHLYILSPRLVLSFLISMNSHMDGELACDEINQESNGFIWACLLF